MLSSKLGSDSVESAIGVEDVRKPDAANPDY